MACEGARERRDGLIADMVKLADAVSVDGMRHQAIAHNVVLNNSDTVAVFFAGYLGAAIGHLAAAVIALAGPCCGECDDDAQSSVPPVMPPQDWERP